jgi:phospholipase/carboxylesterase
VLDSIETTTGREPRLAVLWLHGLGADGHDFEPLVPELDLHASVRFVFPHAPHRAVTINGGMRMRAWYDILGFGERVAQDEAGIRESAAALGKLVDREIERGMPPTRIVLAGFSQGGAIALHAGLREPRPLGGILALSTYLPLAPTLAAERSAQNAAVPICMLHGTDDPVIPLSAAAASKALLEEHGYRVEWRAYPMAHSVCAAEVRDIAGWIEQRANA